MDTDSPTLKPCPFCGAKGEPVINLNSTTELYRVHCTQCEAHTWPERRKTNAAANWNSRPIEDAFKLTITGLGEEWQKERDARVRIEDQMYIARGMLSNALEMLIDHGKDNPHDTA
jgi:Lar family restriction alleviation protein